VGGGEFVHCTVTYTPPYLSLLKTVDNGTTGATHTAANFTLAATGQSAPNSTITGAGNAAASVTKRPVAVGAYALTETAPSGGSAWEAGYTWSGLTCTGATPTVTQDSVTGVSAASVTIAAGGNVTCTYTNRANPKAATVTIQKIVQNAQGGNPQPASGWTVGATLNSPAAGVTITTPPTAVTQPVTGAVLTPWTVRFRPGNTVANVRIQETLQAGHDFVSSSCVITAASGGATRTQNLGSANAVMSGLAPGESALCTFTNKQQPGSITLTKVNASDATLAGARFQLWNDVNGNGTLEPTIDTVLGAEVTTPANGVAAWGTLLWGRYLVQEVAAPPGYLLGTTTVWPINVGASTPARLAWDLGRIVNTPVTPPTIPLTGGLGRDFYTVAGLGVIGLALAAFMVSGVKARRRATG